MFSMAGVNKRRFIDAVKADPQTYADWVGNGEWDYRDRPARRTTCSRRSCASRSRRRSTPACIPPYLHTIAGTWGTVSDQGDLTYLNLVHLPRSTAPIPTT